MMERESIELVAFGDVLRTFRKRRRLSQQRLAEALGVHRNTIGAWERGDNLPESKAIILELAHHLVLNEQETRLLLEASLTALSSHWSVPYPRNPFFMGREELLQQLHLALSPGEMNTLTSAQPCALRGLGGIGKTQVAIEYAYRHYQDYTAVFWIRAETLETILASFASIANHLSLAVSQDENQIVEAVKRWLTVHRGWLLVVDNVENIGLVKSFFPPARQGAILLTTRLQALSGLAQVIEMQPMTLEEGTRFLLQRVAHLDSSVSSKRISVEDYAAAKMIVTTMDGLPLALDQAGAYIEETQCSFVDFLRLFEAYPLSSLLHERDASSEHPVSVVRTFALSFEKIRQINPAAADLLTICSFLAPDAVPEEMLIQGASTLVHPALAGPLLFRAALRDLLAYSLIQRNAEAKTLTIHRLVQTVLKERLPEMEQRTWAKRAIQLIDQFFPDDLLASEYQQNCEHLLPHALVCLSFLERGNTDLLEISSLRVKMAWYLLSRGRYGEAEPLWLDALQSFEAHLGPDHLEMIPSLSGLATLSILQGKYTQAERLFRQARRIWESGPARDNLVLAYSLHGLAVISRDQGRYEEAEALFQQALQIREQIQGVDHPWVAMTVNDLAHLFLRQGKYLQAERLFQRAIRIWEQAGSNATDPYLARCLNSLATLYSMEGKSREASSLVQYALQIWKQERRFNHPYQVY